MDLQKLSRTDPFLISASNLPLDDFIRLCDQSLDQTDITWPTFRQRYQMRYGAYPDVEYVFALDKDQYIWSAAHYHQELCKISSNFYPLFLCICDSLRQGNVDLVKHFLVFYPFEDVNEIMDICACLLNTYDLKFVPLIPWINDHKSKVTSQFSGFPFERLKRGTKPKEEVFAYLHAIHHHCATIVDVLVAILTPEERSLYITECSEEDRKRIENVIVRARCPDMIVIDRIKQFDSLHDNPDTIKQSITKMVDVFLPRILIIRAIILLDLPDVAIEWETKHQTIIGPAFAAMCGSIRILTRLLELDPDRIKNSSNWRMPHDHFVQYRNYIRPARIPLVLSFMQENVIDYKSNYIYVLLAAYIGDPLVLEIDPMWHFFAAHVLFDEGHKELAGKLLNEKTKPNLRCQSKDFFIFACRHNVPVNTIQLLNVASFVPNYPEHCIIRDYLSKQKEEELKSMRPCDWTAIVSTRPFDDFYVQFSYMNTHLKVKSDHLSLIVFPRFQMSQLIKEKKRGNVDYVTHVVRRPQFRELIEDGDTLITEAQAAYATT